MKLSTSTNIMDVVNGVHGAVTMEECIRACHRAGYRSLDMNFHDMSRPGMPLASDGWESWLDGVGTLGAELGITFGQAHSHFYNVCKQDVPDREWREELVRRAIIGSGRLGIKWMVIHTGTVREEGYSMKESKEFMLGYIGRHLEHSRRYGVGICVENLFDNTPNLRKYGATGEELMDLCDTVNDPLFGIIWDFGHGHLMGVPQRTNLLKLGRRIKATHVHDNFGIKDEHSMPLIGGNIDWAEMVQTLREIGYEGDFAYELITNKIPVNCREEFLKFTFKIGEFLLNGCNYTV